MLEDLIELAKLAHEADNDDLAFTILEAATELAPAYAFGDEDLYALIFFDEPVIEQSAMICNQGDDCCS